MHLVGSSTHCIHCLFYITTFQKLVLFHSWNKWINYESKLVVSGRRSGLHTLANVSDISRKYGPSFVKKDPVTLSYLPAFWIVEMPLTVDHPTERTVEVQCDRHPTAITLDIQPCDMSVVMMVQGFQCVDGHRVSTSTISQPLLGCGQLQLFKSITLVYNYNKNFYRI